MKLRRFMFAACALALHAQAQSTDPQLWADALIDSPALVTNDDGARVEQWLGLIERDPGHPLVELALGMLDGMGHDPEALDARLLALDATRMTPASAARLARMQSERKIARTPLEALGRWPQGTLFADRLSRGLVLGPLADPHDGARRALLFADPGFEREHEGPYDWKERWRPMLRRPAESAFDPDDALYVESGWAMSAFFFDAPSGGPAWIELDFSGDYGPRWISHLSASGGGFSGSLDDPSCDVALNGAATHHIDFLASERSLVEHMPVVLRSGRNRLLVASNLDAHVRFALRVLAPDGRAFAGIVERDADGALGTEISAQVPSKRLANAETYLEGLPQRSANLEALLGIAAYMDARTGEAIAHLQKAVELEPTRVGPRLALAELFGEGGYLPETWRRSRHRELVEQLVGENPANARMQLALARILAPEDREEEALAVVKSVEAAAPAQPDAPLLLADLYGRLELEVPAERALFDAAQRAPRSPQVLGLLANHWAQSDQDARSLEQHELLLRAGGFNVEAVDSLAAAHARQGHVEDALALYRAAAALGGENELNALASQLESMRNYAEADALLAELEARHGTLAYFALRRADIARRRNDRDSELIHLREALRRDVSNSNARERLLALTGRDDAREFQKRWAVDVKAELANYDPQRWKEHVVRQIDSAVMYVFADGAWEQITHERDVACDLEGCETLGKLSPSGDVLKIATIKAATGVEYEPVLVDGEYVMPALEPGDAVEVISRVFGSAPDDGVVRLPSWYFASIDKPFGVSRYVVSIPKSLNLRLVLRNFDGANAQHDEGANVVHEFVRRNVDRVVPEPSSPPADWYLPWLVFGEDATLASIAAQLSEDVIVPTRVTPEIRAAALAAIDGVVGENARAKRLYAFATEALDKRTNTLASATSALLLREGNATLLFAALLDAAEIDNELVWARAMSPDADGDPDPAFVDVGRWRQRLYVLAKPDDGPEAWCELSSKTMPYATIVNESPRALAYATRTQRWIESPALELAQRPGQSLALLIKLGAERAAEVELTFELTGNRGFQLKEPMRESPKAQVKQAVQQIAARALRGLTMKDYELRGLDDETTPVTFAASGTHATFLDEQKGELFCKLPFPALQLAGRASGEGRRTQALFLGVSRVDRTRARIELPEGLKLAQPPTELSEEFHGATYRLALEDVSDKGFTIVREFLSPPLLLKPEEHASFVAFAKRVDEVERSRLRFVRAP